MSSNWENQNKDNSVGVRGATTGKHEKIHSDKENDDLILVLISNDKCLCLPNQQNFYIPNPSEKLLPFIGDR